MSANCPVKGCDLPELHSFLRVSADGTSVLHLPDPDPNGVPVTCWFDKGDLGYITDALMDAADKRRERGGTLHERIANHLDALAIRIHEMKPDGLTREIR